MQVGSRVINRWAFPPGSVRLSLLACLFTMVSGLPVVGQERPHILLILADDLGYGDVRCYNPESKITTPRLDGLARQGLRLTDAHSPCTVCTPTRYGLLTGQMPFRVPRGGTVFTGAGGPSLIADERLTMPEMLKQQGYRTACVGKWHLGLTFYDQQGQPIHKGGLEAVQQIDYSKGFDGGPLEHGFDAFFGTACCPTTDWLYAYLVGREIPNAPTRQLDRGPLPKHPYSRDNRGGMVAEDFDLQRVDLRFLEESQRVIREHAEQHPDQPLFLFHAMQAVHLPSFAAPRFEGVSGAGPHGDFIAELDWVVGQLLDTLEETGMSDNTLVMFTSDNGPETTAVVHMREDHQHDPARPWRGMKRDNWEGGHRVPFLVRWPGRIPPGRQSNQLTGLTDVMATVAGFLEIPLPEDAAEDSFDMGSDWTGQAQDPIRDFLLIQGFGGARYLAIRQGRWKYLAHTGSGGNRYQGNARLEPYRLPNTAPEAAGQLFDLAADPGERTNLALENPDLAARLNQLLESSKASGRSAPMRSDPGDE